MHTYKLLGIALLALTSSGANAASNEPAPSFGRLSDDSTASQPTDAAPVALQLTLVPAAILTEIRLIRGTDGKLHKVCREVENPRRRDFDLRIPADGAQQ